MPHPATVVATIARAVLARAVRGQPAAHRSWGQAMLAELDGITDPREATSWALGALWVVWRRRQQAWWGQAWRFATDWRAWRAHPIAPVPLPILVVLAAAAGIPMVIGWQYGSLNGLVEAAIALNLAGRVEASLHPHPMHTQKLPRGDIHDPYRRLLWVGWQVSVPVSVVFVATGVAYFFLSGGWFLPSWLPLYLGYWVLVWPQLAARITLHRYGWRDPRARDPLSI